MASIDRAIVHISDRQKLMDEICRVAVEEGGFKLAWVGMVAPGRFRATGGQGGRHRIS